MVAGAFRLGIPRLIMILGTQVARSVGEPEAKQVDTHTDSFFIAKLWSVMPSMMTCKMTPSSFLPAMLMQPSLKTCINLKTVSFCLISQVGIYAHEWNSQASRDIWSLSAHRSYIQTSAVAHCCCWEVSQASSLVEGLAPAPASKPLGFKPIPQQNTKYPQLSPVCVCGGGHSP